MENLLDSHEMFFLTTPESVSQLSGLLMSPLVIKQNFIGCAKYFVRNLSLGECMKNTFAFLSKSFGQEVIQPHENPRATSSNRCWRSASANA